ncbi:DUF3450 domain-containing protein [Colwellia psychrerythraea]|uniref:Putative conserved protein UCP028069 n=1 Tax=Colwellia psychrerythraea TaxID=28229 RepID=A0A099KEI5_COLPS|nr:DUF3450 domain-containing protein [Colwellia psychrerythraea]KGJ89144.1 putative conserved protein UCP028069 [Colwellia psychrerythraea]
MKLSKLAKASLYLSLSASSLIFATSANATDPSSETSLSKVVNAGQKINQSAVKSQQRVNNLTEQVQTKLQQFHVVTKEVDGLSIYNQQMQTQLDSQLTELAQIAKSMEEVSVIERQISPLMARMISTLAAFVKLDVPFLPNERTKRVADLKSMMKRADIAVSEKFRRVVEAYQIEVDYGRTIEAYSGVLPIEGKKMDVDFLRIGRVSLVYQTRDGSRLGEWQKLSGKTGQTGQWKTLSQDYRLGINKALRIARKQLAPDLILVPISGAVVSINQSSTPAE